MFSGNKGYTMKFPNKIEVKEEVDDLFFDCTQGNWDPKVSAGSA